ncbi:MAG: tRNA (N6-threonylcarbamoyladenosine(37)-N6)-methyltransferase TrmO [Desulfocapsaceae bacterium]|nr:tRNA (N6-threonylcarbamoyladenosine(37)-N6)-methyltransferase TrmO [Desulfocapsaceae bacterium]
MSVIGVIHSCFPEKFGIPRQSGLAPSALATIELLEPFNRPEMVRGLETFSHIWVQFLFHQSRSEGWKATVRPPRMGGKERRGVFATRSPHRPNHIGLSAVRLLELELSEGGVTIEIGGVDMLDGTPVLDIKPYIPYSDCLSGATSGWLLDPGEEMEVVFSKKAELFCRVYEQENGRPLTALIREVLAADPRPASQKGQRSGFGMSFWDVNVRWRVSGTTCRVESCERLTATPA